MSIVAEFVPEEFRIAVCSQWVPLCKAAKKAYFNAARERLAKLLMIDLSYFSNRKNIVIAGGSIIYALNNYVSQREVGDVDIWFLGGSGKNRVERQQIYVDLKAVGYVIDNNYPSRFYYNFKGELLKIIQFKPKPSCTNKTVVQIITTRYACPEDLVSAFCFSPTRCYFYQNRFYRSEITADVHFTRLAYISYDDHGFCSSFELKNILRVLYSNQTRHEEKCNKTTECLCRKQTADELKKIVLEQTSQRLTKASRYRRNRGAMLMIGGSPLQQVKIERHAKVKQLLKLIRKGFRVEQQQQHHLMNSSTQ